MSLDEWALTAAVAFAGLWSGLFAMLTSVLHPMLRAMDGPGFTRFMAAFLPIARRAPFNYACVLGLVISPAVALFALDESGSTAFTLTAIGLALTVAGPLLASNLLAEPNYDVILSRDPNSMPDDWELSRRRYFTFNWIRAAATWASFALFLAALVELLDGA